MGIKEYISKNERIYNGIKDIKYLFCEGKNTDKLIITFPGFSNPGDPPKYNYIRTLKDSNAHKLFLLDDYGPRGSYLIGQNRDDSIEISIISLISILCKEFNIKNENIIAQGSSKGGTCAIYFGIKYGFGYVIAGAPQIRVGTYLLYAGPEELEYITGGQDKEDVKYLDNIIYDLLEMTSKTFPKIFIHVGSGDHHYNEHILPFVHKLDKKGYEYVLDITNYHSHSSLGLYYTDYLIKTLNSIDMNIINPKPLIQKVHIEFVDGALEISCKADGEKLKYSYEIHNDDKIVKKTRFQKYEKYRYPIKSHSTYRARVYVKVGKHINSRITDEITPITLNKRSSRPIRDLKYHLDKLGPSDIDIHGSGNSILIFDYDLKSEVTLGKYIALQSFNSVVSEPFPDEYDIDIPSSWEKSMVEMDLNKNFFSKLSNNKAKYLLIDLLDERMSLVKYKDIIFTFSNIHVKSRILDDYEVEYINKFDLEEDTWKDLMDQYVNGLLRIYDDDKIIIHEVYLNDTYKTINGDIKSFPINNIKYNEKVNELLNQYYVYLKYKLPNSNVIDIHSKFISSEDHIWGLSPIHYEEQYYKEVFKSLKKILKQRSIRTSAVKRFNNVFGGLLRTTE
jgi:hypothetical protein